MPPTGAALEIQGCRFEAEAPELADAIAKAYWEQERPRCLCRPGGIEMYVARLGDGYIVKRMPDTGSQHASDCASFEPSAEASGLVQLLGTAIVEDPTSGATVLKLDFPLSLQSGRPIPARQTAPAGTVRHRGVRLSLRSLLHYLWSEADLTRWHPGFHGKRTWGTVRRQLLQAVEQKTACGATLTSRLYVPETFILDQKDAIIGRRRAIWASASLRPGRPQQLLLTIGEVKEVVPGRHGYRAVIKHIPDVAFAIDEALYRRIESRFADELALWNASDRIRMIMIASFGLSEAGLPFIAGLYLMAATQQWLPVETAAEWQLVERLVRDQRRFSKVLRYDLPKDVRRASVALRDCGTPVPMLFADREVDTVPASPQPSSRADLNRDGRPPSVGP